MVSQINWLEGQIKVQCAIIFDPKTEIIMQDQDLSTMQTFKRLWPMISPYKTGLIVSAVALILNALTDSGLIFLLKPLLDEGFGKADASFLKYMSVFVVLIIILRGVSSFISNYCLAWVSGKVVMTMRRRLFKHLMFMPVSFFDKNAAGKLLSRITYDSEMIASASSGSLITIVREGAYLISLLCVMLYTSWQLSLVLFVIGPIIGILISMVSKKFRNLSRNMQNSMGDLTSTAEQMLKGHKVVLSFGGQIIEEERFNHVSNDMRRKGMKMTAADAIADPFGAFQQESRVQTSLYFQRKYLITFFKDKVLFVHVARAHQRILYERFRKTMLQGRSLSQSLLFPLEFEYTPSEILALEPMLPELQSAGFMIEIEGNIVRFTGLPPMIKESQVQAFLYDLLERATEDIPQDIITQEEMLAKSLAKSLAIKAGQTLSAEEQEQLVYDLFTCQEPHLSPFGKKIYTELTVGELESRL